MSRVFVGFFHSMKCTIKLHSFLNKCKNRKINGKKIPQGDSNIMKI